jgi:hypothetical protein
MEKLLINKLSFSKRPFPVPADYRPMYKIGIIVMILKICCRAETSGLLKMHLLSWALSSEENANKLQEHILSNYQTDFSVWGIEPALNRAMQFAVADRICEVVNGKNYRLTEKGHNLYSMITKDKEIFEREKLFLFFIGKNKITDSRITAMSKKWSLPHAEN